MAILFAAVADDDTGATDLAGMLTLHGMRAILVMDGVSAAQLAEWAQGAEAVVLGVASRSIPARQAYERTRGAIELLRTLQPRTFYVKYCSTFDSTAEGNIGPSIDAAMDALDESFTIAVPALPVNGRTTYMGHHFVGQQLISDSVLRLHPLNPMINSNLVTHLQSQTRRRVGLVPWPIVNAGTAVLHQQLASMRTEGVEIAMVDCTGDADLQTICEVSRNMRLITGSSGLAMFLPLLWKRDGFWTPSDTDLLPQRRAGGSGFLIVVGSCSEATRRQNEFLEAGGCGAVTLDGLDVLRGQVDPRRSIPAIVAELSAGRTCLLKSSTGPLAVENVQRWADENGMTAIDAGKKIGAALASVVREVTAQAQPEGLIVAGGETSGTICRALGFSGLRIGPNIEPGVPVCVSLTEPPLPVVLKSGNFGSVDFYQRAIASIRSLPVVQQHL